MSTGLSPRIEELLPIDAWELLKSDKDAVLVDVRSKAEWSFVGTPDLSTLNRSAVFVEWAKFPGMSANAEFVEETLAQLDGAKPSAMLFLCRSGVRSLSAADAMLTAFDEKGWQVRCINVVEGFEGDLNAERKRGDLNGWKVRGLPWGQT